MQRELDKEHESLSEALFDASLRLRCFQSAAWEDSSNQWLDKLDHQLQWLHGLTVGPLDAGSLQISTPPDLGELIVMVRHIGSAMQPSRTTGKTGNHFGPTMRPLRTETTGNIVQSQVFFMVHRQQSEAVSIIPW